VCPAGSSLHHVTKWGIKGFCEAVAQEIAPFDIGVTIVEHGGARTEFRYGSLQLADQPLLIVVGSEGSGLSRLVGETCDLTVFVPMIGPAESLNASVAAAVTLAEIARLRRAGLPDRPHPVGVVRPAAR
jgi:23S rRNA (guanosine2251-2'-O)-methyltransferase